MMEVIWTAHTTLCVCVCVLARIKGESWSDLLSLWTKQQKQEGQQSIITSSATEIHVQHTHTHTHADIYIHLGTVHIVFWDESGKSDSEVLNYRIKDREKVFWWILWNIRCFEVLVSGKKTSDPAGEDNNIYSKLNLILKSNANVVLN